MIIITGPGRSGTSLLARLYTELGFNPGGRWEPAWNAGLEDEAVTRMNLALASELGVSADMRRGGRFLQELGKLIRASEGRLSARLHSRARVAVDALRYRRVAIDLLDWSSIARSAERHGEELRALAKERAVVKDPRFCFTLHVWLAGRAQVDAVVLTERSLDALAASRVRVGFTSHRAQVWAKNNYAYGIGLLLSATTEYRIPVTTLQFPDFLEDPDALHAALPLPEPRTPEEFRQAYEAVYDPSLVHDHR